MLSRNLLRRVGGLFGDRKEELADAKVVAPPFLKRTPLEALLIDEDFYLAERTLIQPREGAPDRADWRARH